MLSLVLQGRVIAAHQVEQALALDSWGRALASLKISISRSAVAIMKLW